MAFRYFKDGAWVDPNKVPTGGTAGQVLVKQSATDYDAAWNEPSFYLPKPVVNLSLPQPSGPLRANTWNVDFLFLGFIPCPYPVTVDQIGIAVTVAGAAGCVARLGLYDVGSDGRPGSLLVDAGTVAADSTGNKVITLGAPVTLSRRGVYAAFAPQVTSTSLQVRTRAFAGADYVPASAASFLASTPNNVYSVGSVSGALPANGPTTANFLQSPVTFLRVASLL